MMADERTALGPDLDWLRSVLWPTDGSVRVSLEDRPARGFRRTVTYGVLPSAKRPRLLVPLDPRPARRAALRQFNNSMTQRARLTKELAGHVVALAPGRAVVRDRLHVDVAEGATPQDLDAMLPERFLASVLGRGPITVAVTFGSVRPNRKPVLQIVGSDGTVVGYAKVAWNELTTDLVRNEADALQGFALTPPRAFVVPALIHQGRWGDREVTVTSAFPQRAWRKGPRLAAPPAEVLREVAERHGTMSMRLMDAPLWQDIRRRAQRTTADAAGASVLELADLFERLAGDVEVAVGAWHGDLAPWNMAWSGDRPAVWDWERARNGVPIGLDVAHFAFQLSLRRTDRRPVEAAARSTELALPLLQRLGQPPIRWEVLLATYLFELFLRYDDAAREGVLPDEDPIRSGILAALPGMLRSSR